MAGKLDKLALVEKAIRTYPDFPKKGIFFKDLFGVFADLEVTQEHVCGTRTYAQNV